MALERGRSNNGNGAARGSYLLENGSQIISTDNILDKKPFAYDSWLNFKLKIINSESKITLTISDSNPSNTKIIEHELKNKLDSNKLYLVLGGNEILPQGNLKVDGYSDIDPTNLQGNYIRKLNISGTKSDSVNPFSAEFSLTNDAGLTYTDSEGNTIIAEYKMQSTGSEFDLITPAAAPKVVYTDNALNLTKTTKEGAVKLDAKPTDSTYTIMFKVKTSQKFGSGDRGTSIGANLFYIGSNNTSENYYRIGISDKNDPRPLQFFEKNSQIDVAAGNKIFEDVNSKYVAYVIDGKKSTHILILLKILFNFAAMVTSLMNLIKVI